MIQDESAWAALAKFVEAHLQDDLAQLALKKELVAGFENRFVLDQIHGKQKSKTKLPFLFERTKVLYPAKVSVEQSTSQQVALWKSALVEGESLLDMTGGFGVDSFFFAQKMKRVIYTEQQEALQQIVQHNFKVLEVPNIDTLNIDAIDFLENTPDYFDWIYLDPARRDTVGNRKIGLEDYVPNIISIKHLLFKKGRHLLLKTSPMLDIHLAIQQLGIVAKVWVVAAQNEVKELLFLMDSVSNLPLTTSDVTIQPTLFECVNLGKEDKIETYIPSLSQEEITYAFPKKYLYEPNATILKAGLFKEIAIDFQLLKLHPNTHLYTSDNLLMDFPGRIFTCEATIAYQKKQIRSYLTKDQANIATRNFPHTVAQIKQKLGIKDGGMTYLFGTTLMDSSLKILICRKVG